MQRRIPRDMFYGAKPDTFLKAKQLRENMTNPEKILWSKLNNKQLGVRFKPQHPIDFFIVDFYCHQFKLVIEVDGEIHKYRLDYDNARTAELERFGLTVIRFKNQEIIENVDGVVERIKERIEFMKIENL